MNEEFEVLKTVSGRLEQAGIPYMLTGSVASNFYTIPRMTRDIDIVIEAKREDANRLLALFQKDFYIDRETILEAIEIQGMFNIIHNQHVVKVDFIIRKQSAYRELEFTRRRKISLSDFQISIVSLEDLILSKLAWAKDSLSEMQLGDVRKLLSDAAPLDSHYLQQWVKTLELQTVYEKVKP